MVHEQRQAAEPAPNTDTATNPASVSTEVSAQRESLQPSAVLWLQRSAGNSAVARFVGGAPLSVQRGDPPADPAVEARKAAEQALRPAIERVLTDTSTDPHFDFPAKLREAVVTALATTDIEARGHAEAAATEIAGLTSDTFDIPLLLVALDGLHRDATGLDGVTVSAGVRQVIRVLGAHATTAIADVMSGSPPYLYEVENDIESAAVAVGDATALLRLELEGTITELIDLRRTFASAADDVTRAQAGKAVGEAARTALMLDQALRKAAKDPGAPLDTEVEARASEIARIRETAAKEQATKTAMDDNLSLLSEQPVAITDEDPLGEYSETAVQPEEAFPETTDEAELTMAS